MTKMLVLLHVVAGSIAVIGMVIAMATKKGGLWHRRGGQAYSAGMLVTLVLALIISVITRNLFLFSIGIFSGYMVYTGWRVAKVRNGVMSTVDRVALFSLAVTVVAMIGLGVLMLSRGQYMGVVQIVFGLLASALVVQDYRFKGSWPRTKERVALHLGRMGGATIATITAVLVTNVQTQPAFLAWLAPSVVGVPFIAYWTRQVMGGGVKSP